MARKKSILSMIIAVIVLATMGFATTGSFAATNVTKSAKSQKTPKMFYTFEKGSEYEYVKPGKSADFNKESRIPAKSVVKKVYPYKKTVKVGKKKYTFKVTYIGSSSTRSAAAGKYNEYTELFKGRGYSRTAGSYMVTSVPTIKGYSLKTGKVTTVTKNVTPSSAMAKSIVASPYYRYDGHTYKKYITKSPTVKVVKSKNGKKITVTYGLYGVRDDVNTKIEKEKLYDRTGAKQIKTGKTYTTITQTLVYVKK